uniref:Secreted protein n=1 Tax=Monodon monoceros TaxID=40151 RepID=A0A8C6F174_MONMO
MELHFFFFFLMEVNSCLTILPSDDSSRELGKQTTARGMRSEDCVAVAVVPAFTPVSLEEVGSRITHQSYAMTCCFLISWNVPGEKVSLACARLCSFLLFI